MRFALALATCAALAPCACGGDQPGAGPSASREVLSLRLETAHFKVWAGRAAPATLSRVADRLEAELPRISADLGVSVFPATTVEVWSDSESFYADMAVTIGQRYDGATGYVHGPTSLTILDGSNADGRATHELAHCVSLRVNSTIGNNPRWLWETVAVYENGEFVDPRTLAYMKNGNSPTLAQLNSDYSGGRQVYETGYVLGEFIVTTWGRSGLVGLVQANGDVERVCGLTVAQFEQRWAAFVADKYLR